MYVVSFVSSFTLFIHWVAQLLLMLLSICCCLSERQAGMRTEAIGCAACCPAVLTYCRLSCCCHITVANTATSFDVVCTRGDGSWPAPFVVNVTAETSTPAGAPDTCKASTSADVAVTVEQLPTITVQADNKTICSSDSTVDLSFTVTSSNPQGGAINLTPAVPDGVTCTFPPTGK